MSMKPLWMVGSAKRRWRRDWRSDGEREGEVNSERRSAVMVVMLDLDYL
jgi:hypothetical protein